MTSSLSSSVLYPLTSPQREIWFEQMLHGDAPLYNIGGYMRLAGEIDVSRFRQAAQLLVQKHDVLRTVLAVAQDEEGVPMQTFAEHLQVHVPLLDFSGEQEPERIALQWMQERLAEPFSLEAAEPLFRYALIKLASRSFLYFACYHHLIADGWTIALLTRSHAALYTTLEAGEEVDAIAPSYTAFIDNDRSYARSDAFASQRGYWLQKFSPLPEPLLAVRHHGESLESSARSACSTLSLPREWYVRLIRFAQDHGATTFHAILGAVYTYFTRTAQRSELAIGLSVLNRSNAAFKATAGSFAGVTAARFRFGSDMRFSELLQAIGRELKQNYRHQRFPVSSLNRDASRVDTEQPQLFDIGVSYERHDYQAAFGKTSGIAIPLVNEYQVNPLRLFVREFRDDDAVQIDFVYHKAYFNGEEIAAIQQRLVHLLDVAQQTSDLPLRALPVVTLEERRLLIESWNATDVDYSRMRPVHELIEHQAHATPDALALVFGERRISYRTLNEAANRLAHRLIAAGVNADALVGICAERSVEMVVGLLAILKAGGAYVPLDPDYPRERLATMLDDAGTSWVLTQAAVWARIGLDSDLDLPQERMQVIDLDMAETAGFPACDPGVAVDLRQLAYMIYTSGSTGKPKGAGVPHGGLCNRLLWMQDAYRLSSEDRVLQKTPFSFDVSVWEFFWPLMTGAVLVVAKPGDHKDPARLAEVIQREDVTTLHFVPSMLQAFVEHGALPQCTSLRQVMASGEALSAELQRRFYQQSKAVIYNLYGPTEASIDVTAWECMDESAHIVPIGRPIANTRIYLLDDEMEPVPAGVPGELYIGGVQLARGYHRRPDLTAERFVPDPFGAPGSRLYRSGDLACWRSDGVIEYLGRTDHQVKIRGQRIELGEIEAALLAHPGMREAVVMAREDHIGDKRLVAYAVMQDAFNDNLTAQLQAARVSQWQELYDGISGRSETEADLDFVGWNSSYTGQPVPEAEMQDFNAHTVERILALKPRKVLEIGCGTGLLLLNIAPHCERYVGTDFSAETLRILESKVNAKGWKHVRLMHRIAQDFAGIEEGGFDTVIINSVIQYFPNCDYLMDVLSGALRMLKADGRLFIGDVRHLQLLGAFHSSVQLFKSNAEIPSRELGEQVHQAISLEKELLVAPGFFFALQQRFPVIQTIRIQPKANRYVNEMSKFRYDAILHLSPLATPSRRHQLNWLKDGLSGAGLQQILTESNHDAVCVTHIPNARVAEDVMIHELLERGAAATAGELKAHPDIGVVLENSLSTFELARMCQQSGYQLELSWAGGDSRGSYDALLWKAGKHTIPFAFPNQPSCRTDAKAGPGKYTNNPMLNAVKAQAAALLKESIEKILPRYMVPDHVVMLAQIPLTTNGKIDRKALPAPHIHRNPDEYVAPRTRTEAMLADCWAELLKLERIGANDNFFDLGGHSLLAAQLVSRLRGLANVELPLRAVFEAPTLQQLAMRIEALSQSGQAAAASRVGTDFCAHAVDAPDAAWAVPAHPTRFTADRAAPLPLSFPQQRMWFLERLEPGSAFYNMAGGLRLTGTLDIAALEEAINAIVQRHEALRTTIDMRGDNAVQVIAAPVRMHLAVIDLSGLPEQDREAEARRLANIEAAYPFDLQSAPMMRAQLLRLDEHHHWLLLTLHHIAGDGWSMRILQNEIAALYNMHADGGCAVRTAHPPCLPPLPLQYADFAVWQRKLSQSAQWQRQLDYWRNQLTGAPTLLELPTDHARPAVQSYRGAHIRFALPDELARRLHALSRENGSTLFMTLLGAFGVLLSRYSAQDDICIGTPVANRRHAEFDGLIGCFVNMLVLRLKLQGNPGFKHLLRQVRETALQAYAHQDIPFEQLVDALHPERDLSHAPLFQVMFALEHKAASVVALDGIEYQPLDIDLPISKFDLTLTMREESDRLEGLFEYSTDLFERATIARMIDHFQTLLAAIVKHPETPVAVLDMLTGQERHFLLAELNQSRHDFPLDQTYAALFAEQVARHPNKTAAVCMGESLTYRELDERSTRIARALVAAGAGPDTLVGTVGERNLCFLAMMVAIFKAEAAYVPLDVKHPVQRLREIVARGKIPLILTSEQSLSLLDPVLSGLDNAPVALIAERFWLDGDATPLPPMGSPDNLAYVIFTSGSTGQPKGAMVEHKGMLNNLFGKIPAIGLNEGDRVAQTASPAFDISVWQFLAAPLLGGTVHIMPDEVAHDPQRLLDALAEQQVSVLQVVPSMMRPLLETPAEHLSSHLPFSLRCVLSIGEALPPSLAQAWFERFPLIPLVNIYGPAECADNVAFLTMHSMEEARAYHALASVPVGRPTANTQLFVLDAQLQPVPVGVPGEICIAGTGVGRGYLNDPETTGKAFVTHPFEPGKRFYRTGDRGRYRPDGAIDYLGRRDHQVKIRGQRIELGEIESRLRCLPEVLDAVVIGRKNQKGETILIAYCVARNRPDSTPSRDMDAHFADTLRRELAQSLPHAMIPSHFVMLDKLPLNANGKVDRTVLAALPWKEEERQFEAPCTSVEDRLAIIWSALLGHEHIGRDDNFFHLGGHSLLATQVISQIRNVFDVELPLRSIFEASSLRELALHIEDAEEAQGESQTGGLTLTPVERSAAMPASFSQQRLWFLDQLEPGSAMYHIPGALRLSGELDVEALKGALNDIVARHEVLRTTFDTFHGEAVQKIAVDVNVPFTVHDLSPLEDEQRQTHARRLAAEEALRPFDLRVGPMLRAQLLRLHEGEHWLLLTMHHIAADGWSIGIVLRELTAFYRARCQETAPALPVLPIQYADFAVWQRALQQGTRREQQLAYWRAQLDGAPALLELPTDHPRLAVPSHRGDRFAFEIDETLTAGLHALGHRAHATLFMTLSSAFALLLGRYSRQSDLCIGTPVANRQRHELEDLIGFFVNTLVLRFRLNGELTFPQLLRQTREMALAAYAHQDMPFEQLVEALQPERHLSHSPLFQAMFVLQNTQTAPITLPGLQAEPLQIDMPSVAKFDLTLNVTEQGKHLQAIFEFNPDLFERDSIVRMSRNFRHLLHAILAEPDTAIAELPLLSSEERHRILVEWNQPPAAVSSAHTIHQLFEACVQDHPDRIALVFQEQQLSYAELNAKANSLAHYLREQGVCADELVGICAERSLEMIVAVLGVLKAGGAYLPLDPALPQARMAYMINDARPKLLLTQEHLLTRFPEMNIAQVCLDRDAAMLFSGPTHNLPQQTDPEHLAYVIYTSGSTGNPKGTLIHHRALVSFLLAQQGELVPRPGLRVLQWASLNFDLSIWDIFLTLTAGAELYLTTREAVLPGKNLFDTLRRHRIQRVMMTPSSLAVLPLEPLPDLEMLIVAGERCDRALIGPWMQHCAVINAYGPTETTVWATLYPCMDDGKHHTPIGRPLVNTQTYILDAWLNPVPVGVVGELYIGGDGLARGYLGRPDLTAERFIQNPFSDQPGARMYKTGDLARYLPDGHIEYVGRIDHQVKIRGYRVELGEIECALDQLPSVREAVVLAQEASAGGQRLVAYVVLESAASAELDSSKLRTALGRSLPDYMVPSHFVFLDHIPVNTNGKIDRKSLDALEWEEDELVYVSPCTSTEERLAAIWSALLSRKQVGRDENFFHIGGHSLLAVRLTARINEDFQCALPVSQIFLSPTIATLAETIDTRSSAAQLVVPLKQGGNGAPIWLIHPAGGTVFSYRKLAERFDDDRPVYAIQSPEIAGLDRGSYDFEMLCRLYVSEITRLQADGTVYLAGWSMGGALAFCIAGILESTGRQVGWVGLFDTLLVRNGKPQSFEEFVAWAFARVHPEALASGQALEIAQMAHVRASKYVEQYGVETLVQKLCANPRYLTEELGLDANYIEFLQQQYRIQQAHARSMADFVPGMIDAPLHVFCAEESVREEVGQLDWLVHTHKLERSTQHILPGHHDNMILLDENVAVIAQVFAAS